MQIEVKGRNIPSPTTCGSTSRSASRKVGKQVSELAELEVELFEERNPRSRTPGRRGDAPPQGRRRCALATPRRDMTHSINLCADELARQVKRHRDKRRKRRETRAAQQAACDGGAAAARQRGAEAA